jgi:hypothetical protein
MFFIIIKYAFIYLIEVYDIYCKYPVLTEVPNSNVLVLMVCWPYSKGQSCADPSLELSVDTPI